MMLARYLLALAALLVLSLPVAAEDKSSDETPSAKATFRTELEKETFDLVNGYRKDHKLPPFEWSAAIAKVSRGHSRNMASGETDFGHDGFNKRVDVLKVKLPGLRGAGENVLRTNHPDGLAKLALQSWLGSPHHLKNIRGDFNLSGLGVWVDDEGMVYFTQIFIKTVPVVKEPEPTAKVETALTTNPFGFSTSATSNTRARP